jgi:hypothetical protein
LALRWITGAVVVFGLGVLATFLTLVQPLRTQNQNLQAELQTSRQELQDTQADLESLDPLEQDYEQAQISLALLDVRQDVTAAQLALAQDDPLAVRAALSGTDAKLQTLRSRLAGSAADSVLGMRNRLTLVLDEFEDDPFAAQNDLEVLASNLDTLHEALFGE